MNRGARGWEPPKRKVEVERDGRTYRDVTDMTDTEPTIDLVEHNGTWMTKEDAKK